MPEPPGPCAAPVRRLPSACQRPTLSATPRHGIPPLPSYLDSLRPLLPARFRNRPPLVPVVRLTGAIGSISALRPGLSIASCAPALERAFSMKGA